MAQQLSPPYIPRRIIRGMIVVLGVGLFASLYVCFASVLVRIEASKGHEQQ